MCQLCGGTQVVYQTNGAIMQVMPCPNCNKAFRKEKEREANVAFGRG